MISCSFTATQSGFKGKQIEVECDITNGLPAFSIVGLGSKSVDEAKDRVRSAIRNTGLKVPPKRITINLAPADIPKEGTAYDLAIAVSILAATGQIENEKLERSLFLGELALNGELRPVNGVISLVELAANSDIDTLYVSEKNAEEAALIHDIDVKPIKTLKQLYRHLVDEKEIATKQPTKIITKQEKHEYDFSRIYGQQSAKRALEIAAAGNHNVLMTGPPGAGKTLLARSLVSILPPPSFNEAFEITKLHSLAGKHGFKIKSQRPFRSPHHTASNIALIGGGRNPKPGEISLAHRGVLFLDEIAEFPRNVIEVLRQPLEDGNVTISRAQTTVSYPADFMLVATQNPCPCGYVDDPKKACECTTAQIQRYKKKLSGPLLDRIDLVVSVDAVEHKHLMSKAEGETSASVRERVINARKTQANRFNSTLKTNASMQNSDIKANVKLKPKVKQLARQALERLGLSARGYMRVLKVARTIADIEESTEVEIHHLSEALQYRHSRS